MNSTVSRHPQTTRSGHRRLAAFVALAVLVAATPAVAAVFSVGPGATCTHGSLQAALDAAANSPGPDIVKIVRSATWTGIQASTQTDQDVEIIGGYLACDSTFPDGKTTLSGAGGQARSVIALRGNGVFRLRNLVIRDGDQAGDDDGGGIFFQGGGIVDIADSEIVENEAEDGGGIYAQGTSTLAELIIGANVTIGSNSARRHGGGVAAHNIEMSMTAPGSILFMNTAGSRGGGLLLASGDFTAHAYIGSGGVADLGPVYGNQAAIGGGIAVVGGENSGRIAQVQVFSTNQAVPLRIRDNIASQRGGGIDLHPDGNTIGSGNAPAIAQLRHVAIEGNTAPVGAAINLAHDNYDIGGSLAIGGELYFNQQYPGRPLHPAAAACPFGAPCGYIRHNDTLNTSGAIVHFSEHADLLGSRIAIEGNQGGWLMYLSGEEWTRLELDNSLIAGNTVQHALIRDDQNRDGNLQLVKLHYLTITGNSIGANGVLSINEDMLFTRSLVYQPGKRMIASDVGTIGGVHDYEYVISDSLSFLSGVAFASPRFVDPANGDYMPRAGSLAVDYAPPLAQFTQDLHSHTRTIDLAGNPNSNGGASDAGALEREYLQPLVLNADFDSDLNLWPGLGPESNWDGSQNSAGAPGSGSARVVYNTDPKPGLRAPRLAGRQQCIHLPGPGTYELTGWGRVVPSSNPPLTSNRARLTWELRYNPGNFGCDDGLPNLGGSHVLASTATWARPAGALIHVPSGSGLWTVNSSLTVKLDVIGEPLNPPAAWFDGITLELVTVDDTIFADGFEP